MLGLVRIVIPTSEWESARDAFRSAAAGGHELLLYFAGVVGVGEGRVTRVVVPRQRGSAAACEPETDDLDRISAELVERGEILMLQLHTHPGRAFLSGTDRTYPASRRLGWISAVAPDFGLGLAPDRFGPLRAWEHVREGWREIDSDDVARRVVVAA